MSQTVAHFMIKDPVVMNENDSLQMVMDEMAEKGVSHMVINNNQNEITGIISRYDLLTRLQILINSTGGKTYSRMELDSIKARHIMTTDLLVVKPGNAIDYAVELLLQKRFHCLPVVEDKKAVGIITFYDLLKAYYQQHG